MTILIRILLAILAATELAVGVWNQFWPESFYRDVPTVDLTPPFSEHYARDFGGASVGLAIVLAVAAVVPRTVLVITAAAAFSAFSLPHLVFHLEHLEGATTGQAVELSLSTAAAAAAGILVIVLAVLRGRRRSHLMSRRQPSTGSRLDR